MKFNTKKLPDSVTKPTSIGNVYSCRGGGSKNSPKLWVLIAILDGYGTLIGLNGAGEICSGQKYALHAINRWAVIGFCKEIPTMELTLELY